LRALVKTPILSRMSATHTTFENTRAGVSISGTTVAYWALRIGAAMCFIGHGAFGFITKKAWLPYFAVVGIPEPVAWKLMPVIGAVDVMAGMCVLFAPRGLPLVYMAVWALWTALLRPLSGEPFFEAVERAGNYGVPFALLLLTAMPRTWRGLTMLLEGTTESPVVTDRVIKTLKWTTALLLAAHGALGAITGKAMFATHYAAVGLPATTTALVGWFEIALAIAVLTRPYVGLLLFIAAWKVATESLFVVAGAPIWEFVERFGSYVAPIALAALLRHRSAER
jgi:hypothetical protein